MRLLQDATTDLHINPWLVAITALMFGSLAILYLLVGDSVLVFRIPGMETVTLHTTEHVVQNGPTHGHEDQSTTQDLHGEIELGVRIVI